MPTDMSASLPLILLGLVAFVVAVWVLSRLNRKARVIADDTAPALVRDVLDEGAERAQRNQSLIDAPPAAVKDAPVAAPTPEAEAAPEPAPETAPETAPEPELAPAPAPPLVAVPAPAPSPSPATPAPAPAPADDLARIKGVGPKLVALLGELGVTSCAQVAAWTDADVERIDPQLGRFRGRIARDQWIEQARLLAAGDDSAFVTKFGRNG